MDALSIYWNAVWTDLQRHIGGTTEQPHSAAELAAFARAVDPATRPGFRAVPPFRAAGRRV